jgi:hypothetical protein
VRIDKTHEKWATATGISAAVAMVIYVIAALRHHTGTFGGTWVGLFFGTVALAIFIFECLLSLRKKFPVWRIGRAQHWMRGHLWLGLLAYPLVIFHSGFTIGTGIAAWLFWLTTFIVLSGIVGAVLQHFMPSLITQRVGMETIYDQIDRVQGQLLSEADLMVASAKESAAKAGVMVVAGGSGEAGVPLGEITEGKPLEEMQEVYSEMVRPFLATRRAYRDPLYEPKVARGVFTRLRTLMAGDLRETIDDLENIVDEKRDLDRQSRMHRVLHYWLMVHIPLAYLALLLAVVHAIVALKYL